MKSRTSGGGHAVGWVSHHDQLVVGRIFASFPQDSSCNTRWGKLAKGLPRILAIALKRRTLEKNKFGVAPNDAGPLWMGLRIDFTEEQRRLSQNVTYPRGAYVLNMLRAHLCITTAISSSSI